MNTVQKFQIEKVNDGKTGRQARGSQGQADQAAEAHIQSSGLGGLRARDITADAGCALGALYTAFADLDELILHVNSITLARLGAALHRGDGRGRAKGKAQGVGQGILCFARDNRRSWTALFEHRMAPDVPVPEWHLAEHAVLIQHLVEPLAQLLQRWVERSVGPRPHPVWQSTASSPFRSRTGSSASRPPTSKASCWVSSTRWCSGLETERNERCPLALAACPGQDAALSFWASRRVTADDLSHGSPQGSCLSVGVQHDGVHTSQTSKMPQLPASVGSGSPATANSAAGQRRSWWR